MSATPSAPVPPEPSDAVWTIPNALTFLRLAITPAFLVAALGMENMGLAFGLALTGLITDLADGKIARRYGSISRLGIVLDPLADRLSLAAGAVVIIIYELAPLPIILAVAARDVALVLIGVPLLRARGIPIPPVSRLGKIASFLVALMVGTYLAAAIPGVDRPWTSVRASADLLAFIAVPLYYASAAGYVITGLAGYRSGARG